jgi:hypothetical protein
MTMTDIMPDWSKVWTAKQAEDELKGFKFLGPGWYIHAGDALLASPVDVEKKHLWRDRWRKNQAFLFMVYNNRDPRQGMIMAGSAPVRRLM